MTIPSFLLAKLYVKGTLKNTEGGFEFALKNLIDSTSISALGPVVAGGKTYGAEALTLHVEDRTWSAVTLSASASAPMPVGKSFRIVVAGERLPAGSHKVALTAVSTDVGSLKFDFTDAVV